MRKKLYRVFIELTNRKWSSFLVKKFTTSRLSKVLIPSFIKLYEINAAESEKSYKEYTSLQQFFIRKLKKDTRPIEHDLETVVSPVDGTIQASGEITMEGKFIVKGNEYSITELLSGMDNIASYIGGYYIVFYLSPKDYHRIHSPITGNIVNTFQIGNRSYPVNLTGLKFGKKPLTRNYRIVTEIDYQSGKLMVVKVGALFINSIHYTNENQTVQKGEEMAYFSFGSTVVLLMERNTFQPNEKVLKSEIVKMGEGIGYKI